MLTILENHRFLAVVGPSGGGKSSLVLAGLIPSLKDGKLLTAHSNDWHFVVLRPGDSPYRNMALALQERLSSAAGERKFHDCDPEITELVLRSSPIGLVEVLHDAAIAPKSNVLLLVDQFEEIFRFRSQESADRPTSVERRDEAAAFVQLLLETAKQNRYPVHVLLTMRTDFLGECDLFDGLPQAINQCQYLTPRLNLPQLSEAIEQPLKQDPFQGEVAPEVSQKIRNDIGSGRDELPIVQHVLFRAWQTANKRAKEQGRDFVELNLQDYEAAGGLKNALSIHADEALNEFRASGKEQLVQRVFSSLCTRSTNGQYIRRPVTVRQISDESGFSVAEVLSVVEAFRQEDRCFLMPPQDRDLGEDSKIDISHESLLRQWANLKNWAEQESRSATTFIRLRDAALRWPDQEPLLRDPALGLALEWEKQRQPLPGWAARYGGELGRVLKYLTESKMENDRTVKANEATREKELEQARELAKIQELSSKRARHFALAMTVLFVVALLAALYAWQQKLQLQKVSVNLLQTEEQLTATNDELHQTEAQLISTNSELTTAEKKLQVTEADVKSLKADKNSLLKDKSDLTTEIASIEVDKTNLLANEMAISNRIISAQITSSNLELEASNLEARVAHIENLSRAYEIVDKAGGVVEMSPSESGVSVNFGEAKVSPDEALKVLPAFGGIRSINLSHTQISDPGLENLTMLTNLVFLDLSYTDIGDIGVGRMAMISQIQKLNLSDTLLTDAGLGQLKTLTNLTCVNLSHNQVNEAAIDDLQSALGRCQIIYDPDPLLNALSKSGGYWAAALDSVKGSGTEGDLVFQGSPITDAAIRILAKRGGLNSVEFSYCNRITNEGLKYLRRIPSLKSIVLQHCTQVSDLGMENVAAITNVQSFVCDDISLTDRGLKAIGLMSNLSNLTITGNAQEITDDGVAALAGLSELDNLSLEFNRDLTGNSIKLITNLKKLRALSLMGDDISGSSYSSLIQLPDLRELNISYNYDLTDRDLLCFESFRKLKMLDISNCWHLTEAGVKKLKKSLPDTKVVWEASIESGSKLLRDQMRNE